MSICDVAYFTYALFHEYVKHTDHEEKRILPKVPEHLLLKDIPASPDVYFVHSYYPSVESKYGVAKTEYMVPFYSIISRDNVAAAQFHPEKSGPVGIQIMRNFIQCEA